MSALPQIVGRKYPFYFIQLCSIVFFILLNRVAHFGEYSEVETFLNELIFPCPRTFGHPPEMIAIQSAYSMICLTFTWTLLNSASSKLVDKACLFGGVYAGWRTVRNLFQYTLPVSIRGEPVAYTARARHSSAFLWLRSSIESKELLIPGGPWAVAIDKVSDSSFSPWIEVEGLLAEVAYCER